MTTLEPFEEGDLYLSVMKGAPGLGDALLRPPAAVARDVAEGHLLPRFAESTYGVVLREDGAPTSRRRRGDGSASGPSVSSAPCRPGSGGPKQRERVLAQEMIEPVEAGYAESMKLSARWAAEYRGFWDLDPGLRVRMRRPRRCRRSTRPRGRSPRRSPRTSSSASSKVDGRSSRAGPPASTLEPETLAAMLDEKLSRKEIKRDPVRLQGPGPLREVDRRSCRSGSPTTRRSCCRWGRG